MRILIIHTSAGSGHTRAAEAVFKELQSAKEHAVVFVDALDYTSAFYKAFYRDTYTFLISRISWAWGTLFAVADVPWLQGCVRGLRRLNNRMAGRRLEKYLTAEQFDVIISTHFFPNEVTAALKRGGRIRSTIISVITDYDVHRIWLAKGIDRYAVACEHTRDKLKSLGIGQERIAITGIPIDAKFSLSVDRSGLKKKLGLKEGVFTVLIATGSFGIGPIAQIARRLEDYQVLVICGRNARLFEQLQQDKNELLKIYGLVDNMDEIMAVADCMVTKPGGLSISEALARRLPLIFFHAIPGQESHNIRVLRKYGVGIEPRRIDEIVSEVNRLGSSRDILVREQHHIDQLARPDAAKSVVALVA
jgi:processive 1,2-diacylglycerol beta-glucosyltransferase